MQPDYGWHYYMKEGGRYYSTFLKRNPEFATKEFEHFVVQRNKADRDSGELADIAKHEVLRLAAEFAEHEWRFPNVHGKAAE